MLATLQFDDLLLLFDMFNSCPSLKDFLNTKINDIKKLPQETVLEPRTLGPGFVVTSLKPTLLDLVMAHTNLDLAISRTTDMSFNLLVRNSFNLLEFRSHYSNSLMYKRVEHVAVIQSVSEVTEIVDVGFFNKVLFCPDTTPLQFLEYQKVFDELKYFVGALESTELIPFVLVNTSTLSDVEIFVLCSLLYCSGLRSVVLGDPFQALSVPTCTLDSLKEEPFSKLEFTILTNSCSLDEFLGHKLLLPHDFSGFTELDVHALQTVSSDHVKTILDKVVTRSIYVKSLIRCSDNFLLQNNSPKKQPSPSNTSLVEMNLSSVRFERFPPICCQVISIQLRY
ncbi:hypothetical protein RCL1_002132 [Eukaryota sp. TZLM3-RCL]